MSTKDNTPGLLSKVAKFVRNPTTNWTDLDKPDAEPDTGYSKQALKEMIERKRQNDFVRKREFDQLRKLRSRDPSAGNPDLAGRPSYFQSSLPSNPDERAMTIKKIDEIEAQMSNQWWQGKNDGKTPTTATKAATEAPVRGVPKTEKPPAEDIGYAATKLAPMASEAGLAEQSDFVPTQTNSSFGKTVLAAQPVAHSNSKRAALAATAPPTAPAQSHRTGDSSGFFNSQSFAVELGDGSTDPDLEEAAIRFANGDNAGAEAGLLDALANGAARRDLAETWTAALFDLYRATGQQARFDSVAIEYAERFGRSAPAWFSMPDMLGLRTTTSTARTVPSQLADDPLWICPAQFERASVDELQLAIANAASPWFLDWGGMRALDLDAVGVLGQLFGDWCTTAVQLRFRGLESLEQVLRDLTPPGDKAVGIAPWRLRLDALRVMQLQDDFELVALEYCVTFEVSPPSWQDARCSFYRDSGEATDARVTDDGLSESGDMRTGAGADSAHALTVPMGLETALATLVELSGEVVGEATESLARLEDARQGGGRLVISCANLIRVDFSAAGSILNWVALRQAEGCNLQFRDVHRLVAAFFNVIGINEHARVVLRSN